MDEEVRIGRHVGAYPIARAFGIDGSLLQKKLVDGDLVDYSALLVAGIFVRSQIFIYKSSAVFTTVSEHKSEQGRTNVTAEMRANKK